MRQLVALLPEVAAGDELLLVGGRDALAALASPGWTRVVVARGDLGLVRDRLLEAYTPWRARAIERVFEGLRADVLFFPQQSIFPLRVSRPAVLTVHDVQHLLHPENFGLFDRTFRARLYPRSLQAAARVVAVSEFTRNALIERCGVAPGKIDVVPHGFDPEGDERSVAPTTLVSGPYLYYPAATFAHKGHETLLRTFAALKKRGAVREKLVFTGLQTALWRKALVPLVRRLGIEADVVHLGFLPYAEVGRLYAGASAVLFPSTYEGFGIPVLEAARFGKRVITSRLEVFDEIGVPRESQVDFADADAVGRMLQGAMAATVLTRRALSRRECAEKTLGVLHAAGLAAPG